ncbi:hypothetical protein PIB30_102572 [Stylosanthes scabra]|uniref:Uncharacterized protein n=1 Tax=Stylosanthes scabra TaxID=79078 RepID=A0ABU6QY24_9FABA|nr:hypothetical protein [Stylosanthes scabra]
MVRTKKPVSKRARGEGSSSTMEAPPQGHPMADWFTNIGDFNNYATNFAPRKIIPPSTLNVEYEDDDLEFTFKLGNNSYSIDSSILMDLWKLDYSGDTLILSDSHIEHHKDYTRIEACNLFNIPFDVPKPTVGYLNIEHRLIHYLITYVLVPRLHNHGLILEEDLEIMWRMVKGKKLNWVVLIASHMQRTKGGKTSKGLPYAILWTKMFEYVGVAFNQVKKKKLEYNHCIDNHVINHMKREATQVQAQEEQADEEGEQAMEEVQEAPHHEQAGPSMNDMMQVLLRIEANQTTMGNRMDRMERNQARMLRKIRRLEAYTFSEDEAEDDDEDQD